MLGTSMPIVTLLEKAYDAFSFETVGSVLSSLCKGLRVEPKIVGKTGRGWIQAQIAGEDEVVALKLIDQQIGLAPPEAGKVERFSLQRGTPLESEKATTELRVDIGISSPTVYDAVIPLQRLQAQLADGKGLPLQRLRDLFCLQDHVPLQVKITSNLIPQRRMWEAEMSEPQLSRFSEWMSSNLDRLIVLGASHREVAHAVKSSGHLRDVVKIESLGPLEHAIECKLGTDAVGLVPKIGSILHRATLATFSPRRIRQATDRPSI